MVRKTKEHFKRPFLAFININLDLNKNKFRLKESILKKKFDYALNQNF